MAQSKGIQFKLTGLIVIDYIVSTVLRESGLDLGLKLGGLAMKVMMK